MPSPSSCLGECDDILARADGYSVESEIKGAALKKIAVLSALSKKACAMSVEREGDPVHTYATICLVGSISDGVDVVHKLLRQAVPEADGVVRHMSEVRKGSFRSVASDVAAAVDYSLPAGWACVSAMRVIVKVLKDLESLASS